MKPSQMLLSLGDAAKDLCRLGQLDDARIAVKAGMQLAVASTIPTQDRACFYIKSSEVLVKCYFCTNQGAEEMRSAISCAKESAETIGSKQCLADALSISGQAEYYSVVNSAQTLSTGQGFDSAFQLQQEALEIREELQDTRGVCESLFYIGVIYERKQQYDKAMDFYNRVLELAKACGHSFEQSEASRHLAGIAWYQGRLDEALEYAQQALNLRNSIEFKLYLPFDYLLLAQVLLKRNEHGRALELYSKALDLAKEMDLKQAQVFAMLGLGDLYLLAERFFDAHGSLTEALKLASELDIPRAVSRAQDLLSRIE